MNRRVVVTGLGAITPVGNTAAAFWEGLVAGRSGIGRITQFDPAGFDSQIAGEVKDFDPSPHIPAKDLRRMERFVQFAVCASRMAVDDASLDMSREDPYRVGVLVGSGIGSLRIVEEQHQVYMEKGPGKITPFLIPMLIANMAPGQISISLGVKGPNSCVATACATGNHAIGDSFKIIQRGDADVMVAGGSESCITPLGVGGFCALKALSRRNDEPQRASRPFDLKRDGFVIGEGCGVVILEEAERATRRGARIYAEVVGYAMTGDAYHMTAPAPDGEGAAQAMRLALKDAKLRPEEVTYINAHGTSTPLNDKTETMAIKAVFGAHAKRLMVSSTKSMTGHLLGATGGIEAIATVKAIHHGVVPPTINYEEPDPECDLDYVPNQARQAAVTAALSNSLGFGGHNATLAFRKFTG